jgi:hypothetical protein
MLATQLFDHYKDTCHKAKEHSRFVQGWRSSEDDVAFAEMRFKVKPGSAVTHASSIQTHINTMMAMIPED